MFDTVSDKRIAVFGFAFKKNTADTRFVKLDISLRKDGQGYTRWSFILLSKGV